MRQSTRGGDAYHAGADRLASQSTAWYMLAGSLRAAAARVRLLGSEQLEPGQDGWLQLRLERPVAAASVGLATAAIILILFTRVLRVPLWQGMLGVLF